MSKITVKPFLNKKIKPTQVYSDLTELGFPLYYSITYQRKTQYLKSFTGAIMTEKAFEYFKEENEPLNYETNYNENSIIALKDEKELIFNAVKYITETELIKDIFDEDFTPRLKEYFEPLKESLFSIGWLNYNHQLELPTFSNNGKSYTAKEFLELKIPLTEDEKRIEKLYGNLENSNFYIENFYRSFNQEKNLLHSIEAIEKVTNTSIEKYFYSNTLKIWYVIDLIIKLYPRSVMIEFVINYDLKKLISMNKKSNNPIPSNEIETISNKLKMNCLGVFIKNS